jgi:hypothetical protein
MEIEGWLGRIDTYWRDSAGSHFFTVQEKRSDAYRGPQVPKRGAPRAAAGWGGTPVLHPSDEDLSLGFIIRAVPFAVLILFFAGTLWGIRVLWGVGKP